MLYNCLLYNYVPWHSWAASDSTSQLSEAPPCNSSPSDTPATDYMYICTPLQGSDQSCRTSPGDAGSPV